MIFQIFLFLFALLAIARTIKQYRRKEASRYWVMVFAVMWLAVLAVAAIPHLADVLADIVGIGRGADVLMYSAILSLMFLASRSLVREQQLSGEMTALVRAVAIENARQPLLK